MGDMTTLPITPLVRPSTLNGVENENFTVSQTESVTRLTNAFRQWGVSVIEATPMLKV